MREVKYVRCADRPPAFLTKNVMMMKPLRFPLALIMGLVLILSACEETISPNITPVVNLTFTVTDGADPIEGAVVYLFPFEGTYTTYLSENPDGNPSITPSVSADNVAVTDANGVATFDQRPLDGNSYASGTTWFHRPNPIYYRVEASKPGPVYLTSDNGGSRISFDEIESGSIVFEEVDVVVE